MEDYVTPASAGYVAPAVFTYAAPKAKDDGARRPNMWGSGEQGDRAKYVEKMEEREFHADKSACSGTLLYRTTGLSAPQAEMSVSDTFLQALATKGADKALQPPDETKAKRPAPAAGTSFAFAADDPEAKRAWEAERDARAAQEAAQAAKRKAKRDKKKAKKKKGAGGAAADNDDDDDDDDDA